MPDILDRTSVASPTWWLRAIVASLMISIAMTMERRADMVFFFSVLSFVGLVTLPSEDAFAGLIDHIQDNPGTAIGGAVALIGLLFFVPFIVGIVAGRPKNGGVTTEHMQDKTRPNRFQSYGYIVTAIAVFAAALLDTIPRGVANVLIGLLSLPMVTGATVLGAQVRDGATKTIKEDGKEAGRRVLLTVYGMVLVMLLLLTRRMVVPQGQALFSREDAEVFDVMKED